MLARKHKALEDLNYLDELTLEEPEHNSDDMLSELSDDNYQKINSYVLLISSRTTNLLFSIDESTYVNWLLTYLLIGILSIYIITVNIRA